MVVLRSMTVAAILVGATTAQAHVTVQPTAAPAGAYQVLRFGVGHGCGDTAATTALRVEIPAGVTVSRPQPKPGWALEIERSGATVTAIVWRGGLPPDQFDEFVILTQLPKSAGPLAFPAIQTCGGTENRWVETSPPGGPRSQRPAPVLNITAPAPDAGHDHH